MSTPKSMTKTRYGITPVMPEEAKTSAGEDAMEERIP